MNSGTMLGGKSLEASRERFPHASHAIVKIESEEPAVPAHVGSAPIPCCSNNSEPGRRKRFQSTIDSGLPFMSQSGSLNDSIVSVSSAASFSVEGRRCHSKRIVLLENLQAEQVRMNGKMLEHVQNQQSLLHLNRSYTDEKTSLLQQQMDTMDENYGRRMLNLETFVQNQSNHLESRAQAVPVLRPAGQIPPRERGPRNLGCSVTSNNVRSSRDVHLQSTAAGAGGRIGQHTTNGGILCPYCGKRLSKPCVLKTHQQWWCKMIPSDTPPYAERMSTCEFCQKEIHKLVMPSHQLTCKSRPWLF